MAKKYDVIVIGAGPGHDSSTYASRANLSVLMLDRGVYGGQMNNDRRSRKLSGLQSLSLGLILARRCTMVQMKRRNSENEGFIPTGNTSRYALTG